MTPRRPPWRCRPALAALVATTFAITSPAAFAAHRAEYVDGAMKAELLAASKPPRQVVWFGSSTSREVDPAQIQRLTGRRAFNASLSAGRPSQARFFARFLGRLFPNRYPHLVLGLDLEQFRIEHDREIRLRPAGASPSPLTRFRVDGFRLANIYAGRPSQLHENIAHYRSRVYPRMQRLSRTQLRALDDFLVAANRHGDVPTIVLYPVHPKFATAMRPHGRLQRLRELRLWLRDRAAKGRRFRVVDMTSLRVFGGSPSGFHDGVHQTSANMRLMVRAVARTGALNPAQS